MTEDPALERGRFKIDVTGMIFALRLFMAVIFSLAGDPVFAEAQTREVPPRNIQIVVEMKQAAFQNQYGAQTTSQSTQTQFIVVTEGAEGKIFLGEKLPYATFYQNYLAKEGYLTSELTFQDVGTSILVRARVLGPGQVEVTLTPEISYVTQDGRGSIAVQKMSTSVIVPDGQALEIGGNISNSEFDSNFYRSTSGQALQIVLTPRIIG